MPKRLFDMLAAATALIFLSPLIVAAAIAVTLSSRGPVFYRQTRIGKDGRPFAIWKFRTMHVGADEERSISVADDERVTRVGRTLRRWKLDELPTLFNVLRGEMSIVGPRPEVPEFVERYSTSERRVLTVRPGITDPATLAFNDEASLLRGADPERIYAQTILPEKLRLSMQYIDRQTFLSDIGIIMQTLGRIISPRRISRGEAERP